MEETRQIDLERARKCVVDYSRSTGLECIIIDAHGEKVFESGVMEESCKFCRKVQDILDQDCLCQKAHLYGAFQAERFGGKYIFFCPMGLVHWASPITSNGVLVGALLGGHVHMIKPDHFFMDDIIKKFHLDAENLRELEEYMNAIPVVSPEKVHSLSEMLFVMSAYLSDIEHLKYLEKREKQEQQSEISEYIKYIKTMGGEEVKQQSYPIEKEKELLALIAVGDTSNAQKVLNEILGYIFFTSGGNFEILKGRVLELIVLLSRAALEGGADIQQIFGLNYQYLSQIHDFHTVDELTFWLSKIMNRFADCVFNFGNVKHVDVIYKSVDYIKRNYMNKISLEEVSAYVHFSPPYFSKIFKEEVKCNFNQYLQRIRIDKSKKLLLNDEIPLVDIANLVGFEDQSYFSKVFKKVVGISPGKYRDCKGNMVIMNKSDRKSKLVVKVI